MNIYQRIILILGALSLVFVLWTAPKYVIENGVKYDYSYFLKKVENLPVEDAEKVKNKIAFLSPSIDVPKTALRIVVVAGVTALLYFAFSNLNNPHFEIRGRILKYGIPLIVFFLLVISVTLIFLIDYSFVYCPPKIIKIDPTIASSVGGTEITITGTGFKTTPTPTVYVGGASAIGVKAVSKTYLKATVPPGVSGSADIIVQNARARVKSLPFKGFSYYDEVMITATSPDPMTADPAVIKAPAY